MVLAGPTQLNKRTTCCCWVSQHNLFVLSLQLIVRRRTLPIFLQNVTDTEISSRNRKVTLDGLRKLSEQSDLALQETCILAWGQIARYVGHTGHAPKMLIPCVVSPKEMK